VTDLPATTACTSNLDGPVIVTGGSSGLGAAVVRAVTAGGGRPVILDRRKPTDPDQTWLEVDLSDPLAAAQAVQEAAVTVGSPVGAVTAAGVDACGRLDEVELLDWTRVIAVNLLGTAAVVRASLPYLRQTRGRIVTVASTLGIKAVSDATAYCASKFGVVGFTRALAVENAGQVGVTLLIPGGMRTPFFDGRPEQYKPGPDAVLAEPDEVAEAVVFALTRPAGVELRELVVCAPTESSWP
jgi:NAD(P)-dependent dehydrogenase (short-subunit alcohol dehydrogenase family)